MPKTTLGIQLSPTDTLVVHLKLGWKGADVVDVERVERPRGDSEGRGLALLEAGLPHADTVIAALPGDAVFQRLVQLPFSDRNKIEQAAPLEAEESLPLSLEELVCHVHLLERRSRHSKVLLAAAPREKLADLLDELRSGGLDPRAVDVEPLAIAAVVRRSLPERRKALVLDLAPHLCQAVLLGPEGPWSFHAFSAGSGDPSLQEEMARYLSRWEGEGIAPGAVHLSGPDALKQDLSQWSTSLGIPVEILPFPTEGVSLTAESEIPWPGWAIPLGLALRESDARAASQINLLQGPFAPLREAGPWKEAAVRGGIYLGVLAALWGIGVWSQSAYRETQLQKLKTAVRQEFQRALPEVKNIVSEVDQMRARVNELEERASILGSLVDRELSPLRILREISTRIPNSLEVELRRLSVEEGRVRLEGITTSFDATNKIRADLAEYPRFRSIPPPVAKKATEPGKVVFELTISLGREG